MAPAAKLRAAPAVPLRPGIGPVPHGAAREQLRIARLGEEFQIFCALAEHERNVQRTHTGLQAARVR